MPLGRLLVRVRGLQNRPFLAVPADELHAEWQAVLGESARHRHGRAAAQVHGRGEREQGRRALLRKGRLRRKVLDRHGRRRHGRAQQHVHRLQGVLDEAPRVLPGDVRLDVVRAGDRDAAFQKRAEGRPVLVRTRRKRLGVRGRGLRGAHRVPQRRGVVDARHVHLVNLGPQVAQHVHRGQHRRAYRGVHVPAAILLVHPDAQAARAVAERVHVVAHGLAARGRVVRVEAGNRAQDRRGVGHAARHRPDVVQRLAQGKHAVAADFSVRRLDADDAAAGRRKPDRAAGVRPQRPETQRRRGRDARAARRRARPMRRTPRVDGRLDGRVIAGQRELRHRELAEQNGARPIEAVHHGRVEVGREVRVHGRRRGGRNPRGVTQVLDRDRDAMQQPPIRAFPDFRFRGRGLLQGEVRGHREIAAQPAVQRGDAVEHGPGQFDRRHVLVLQQFGDFGQRLGTQFVHVRHIGILLHMVGAAGSFDSPPLLA